MSLQLVHAFGFARLVGAPVLDRRRFGLPPGGPFDRESAALARALLGLDAGAPVWEVGMADAEWKVASPGMVAVVGARAAVRIDGQSAGCASLAAPIRSSVHVAPPEDGARVYVAFAPQASGVRKLATPPGSLGTGPLRILPGPQANLFDLSALTSQRFVVGHAADRVGIRLEGVFAPHSYELPSEPACVGAIQVTGGGELAILGPDGPTIGGYPKVAVVVDADLDRLGQLRPGQPVSFGALTITEARQAADLRSKRLADTLAMLRLASQAPLRSLDTQ